MARSVKKMCPGGKNRLKWQNGSEQREWTTINSLRKSLYKMYLGLQYHSKIFHGNLTQRTENHIDILMINEHLFLDKVQESNNILSKLTTLDMLEQHVLILHPFHSKNISYAFHIWTVFHNGFFFNPKTAIKRRISTKAGSTLGEKDRDRNVRRTIKNRATVTNTCMHTHTNTPTCRWQK